VGGSVWAIDFVANYGGFEPVFAFKKLATASIAISR
jgi:hypothetical protein